MAILIQAQPGSFPIYMLTDTEIADPSDVPELANAAPGTMAVTAGFGPAPSGGGGATGGGVLVVNADWDVADGTLDKTWQEIHDAALEQIVILPNDYEDTRKVYYLQTVSSGHGIYGVDFAVNSAGGVDWLHFSANSASDYPVWHE